jgi:N-acetyl-alpha-D-glucosaminyl L-malate synthase BshA
MNHQLDLLHVHYAIPHASTAYMAKQILKKQGKDIPVVTTLHGTDITLVGKDKTYAPVVTFSINESDAITAVSRDLREQTYKYFDIKKDIRVIYNFVDSKRFHRHRRSSCGNALAPHGEKILIHVSNFRPIKRVKDVVLIFKKVLEKIPAKLLLIGDGPDRPLIESMCRELGICGDIRFIGKQEQLEDILGCADLFILPSEYESFGLAALEAMASEVPVISSNAGGLPEINIEGKTGFLSPVGDVDAMAENAIMLLQDPSLLDHFRKQAYQQAKKFEIARIIPQYETLYQELLPQPV